jgi:hypothetical protein
VSPRRLDLLYLNGILVFLISSSWVCTLFTEGMALASAEATRAPAARAVGLGLLLVAVVVAVAAVMSGPHAAPDPVLFMMPPQSCPPPCVPHVFSSSEEALLSSSARKGKLVLPGGDSAVQEAMRAASDADGQMSALATAAPSNTPAIVAPARTAAAVGGHGGRPYVSQWDLLHGELHGDAQTPVAPASGSLRAQGSMHTQTQLRASSGTLEASSGGDSDGAGGSSDPSERRDDARADEDARGDVAGAGSLSQALRSLSNRRLRAIVRLLLKSRAINKSGSSRGGVQMLRAILDGSRKREKESRRREQAELVHIRAAMDELAYKANRRRQESEEYEDAIAALSKRLGEGDGGGDDRSYLRDSERRSSLLGGGEGPARVDDLFERDSSSRGDRSSSTDALLRLLGGGGDSRRRQADRRRHEGGAELKSEASLGSSSSVTTATNSLQSSNKAILQVLAQLAARSPHTRS